MNRRPAVVRALGAAAGLALLGLGYVYGVSEWKLRRTYDAPLAELRAAAPADPAAGLHMARVVGCWAGCHGIRGEGGEERIAGIRERTAPTLTAVVPLYTDAELARLVRYGVKRDGRSVIGMYPRTLWALADQDLANIIAHLRLQPPLPPVPRRQLITLRGRLMLATGRWRVGAEQVDRSVPRWGELPMPTGFERGRYLASIVCSECHGADYRGDPLEGGPSLAVVAAYDAEQFGRLLRTGRPIDGREMPRMNWMPDVGFTEQEIADLYRFLREHHGLAAPK
jgi:mono/diheme cytochrome c family protein